MSESEWIPWSGGECPVSPETIVHFRTRFELANPDMTISEDDTRRADTLRWSDRRSDDDIRAYRIVDPAK